MQYRFAVIYGPTCIFNSLPEISGHGDRDFGQTKNLFRWSIPAGPDIMPSLQHTVCPGSSDPPEKIFNIFESENEVYTNY